MRTPKTKTGIRIVYGFKNFGLATLIYIASRYLAQSGRITAIILGVLFIIGAWRSLGSDTISTFFIGIILGIAFIAVGIADIFGDTIMKYVGALVIAYFAFCNMISLKNFLGIHDTLHRALARLWKLALGGLIIAGIALVTFTEKYELGNWLVLAGCILWALHTIHAIIFIEREYYDQIHSNTTVRADIKYCDVYWMVKKIADNWTGKWDLLSGGVKIKYSVSVDIVGVENDTIQYTVSGQLSGSKADVAKCLDDIMQYGVPNKFNLAMENIVAETKKEMGKGNLSRDYRITANAGQIN